jgi:hypothetical protein
MDTDDHRREASPDHPDLRDYVGWHAAYDDPGSSLSVRLRHVQRAIVEWLERTSGPVRVLSTCAGHTDTRSAVGSSGSDPGSGLGSDQRTPIAPVEHPRGEADIEARRQDALPPYEQAIASRRDLKGKATTQLAFPHADRAPDRDCCRLGHRLGQPVLRHASVAVVAVARGQGAPNANHNWPW